MDLLLAAAVSTWDILRDSAVFILAGFALAGIIKAFAPMDAISSSLGRDGMKSVVKASMAGIPLTLCSCSVTPAAMTLRKMGASRGATTAFLISTPESGADSIAISYALLDPIMTVFRPLAAFVTAAAAGLMENVFNREESGALAGDECHGGCDDACAAPAPGPAGLAKKAGEGLRYAFVDMMDDMAGWMIAGLAAAGIISAALPEGFFTSYMSSSIIAMPVMLLVSVPMYVCASSSTPMAAAMIGKGLSPGAALVFLLAGPATNIGTIMIIRKFMGGRSAVIYTMSIAVCAIALGAALDAVYYGLGADPSVTIGGAVDILPGAVEVPAAAVFIALSAMSFYRGFTGAGAGADA